MRIVSSKSNLKRILTSSFKHSYLFSKLTLTKREDNNKMDQFWKKQMDEQGRDGWYSKALDYWDQQEASVEGVLGGFGSTSNVDLRESKRLIATLRETLKPKFNTVLDCGAGIGRITEGLLQNEWDTVDLLEPCKKQVEEAKRKFDGKNPKVRNLFMKSLQDFDFLENDSNIAEKNSSSTNGSSSAGENSTTGENSVSRIKYDCIWNQWVLLYLTDDDLVTYLQKCQRQLNEGGFIFVKENVLCEPNRGDPNYANELARYKKGYALDEEDNGLTRSDARYREIFKQAGMKLVCAVRQANWPKDLYPIYMYVLQ